MLDGRSTTSRRALSALLVLHVAAMAASLGQETAVGAALRAVTEPWEKVLGVHQAWPMFADPPRATAWLEYTGIGKDGARLPLDPLPGEPPFDGVILLYDRLGKFERNAVSPKREYLRTAVVRAACAADPRLRKVAIARHSRRTPLAWHYDPTPRSAWPVRTDLESTWNCRR